MLHPLNVAGILVNMSFADNIHVDHVRRGLIISHCYFRTAETMENVQQPTVLPRSMALKKTAPGKILLTEYFKKEKKANQNKTN